MGTSSYDSQEIAHEAERVMTAARVRGLAVAVLERGEAERTRARALVRNGVAALTLKLEHESERALRRLSLTSERCVERPLVDILMRLASLIDGSAMPENAVAEVRRMIALGKGR
jgi:hypothetical protein